MLQMPGMRWRDPGLQRRVAGLKAPCPIFHGQCSKISLSFLEDAQPKIFGVLYRMASIYFLAVSRKRGGWSEREDERRERVGTYAARDGVRIRPHQRQREEIGS